MDETNKTELVSVFSQVTPHMTQEISMQFLEPVYNLFKVCVINQLIIVIIIY